MQTFKQYSAILGLALAPVWLAQAATQLTVKAVNPAAFARTSQTIELSASQLAPLGETNLEKIHVRDAGGHDLLCQAVDTDYDAFHKPDEVIFQADFAPGETKTFTVTSGKKWAYKPADFKAYGRFVRERFDDFAWENDLIAHRTYGKALETWQGEPLTSSAIDIWSKRTSRLVIDEWYMVDNYHADQGEGCDDYSAGATRGDGGSGLWAGDELWVSKNFTDSRTLANGPIRVLFELVYDAFDVNGVKISQVTRVSLDAGSQLDHYQVSFHSPAGSPPLTAAVGLKKVKGEQLDFNAGLGALTIWEPMEKKLGMQGLAVIVDPATLIRQADGKKDDLLLVKPGADNAISYWAGFAWDKAGHITTPEAWKSHVSQFAQGLLSPVAITVSAQ